MDGEAVAGGAVAADGEGEAVRGTEATGTQRRQRRQRQQEGTLRQLPEASRRATSANAR